jgi:hypothetical protein
MHLRKLVPLSDLLTGARVPGVPQVSGVPRGFVPKAAPSVPASRPAPVSAKAPPAPAPGPASAAAAAPAAAPSGDSGFKDRFLADVKAGKSTFYNLVVASAFRIDASPAGISFAFLPNQKNAKGQCEEQKAWLASIAEKVAGQPVPVTVVVADAGAQPAPAPASPAGAAKPKAASDDVKEEAMQNSTVQALLEIFPVEKTTIEER